MDMEELSDFGNKVEKFRHQKSLRIISLDGPIIIGREMLLVKYAQTG
jgi:hypothetical protein